VLNPAKFAAVRDGEGKRRGYFFFSLKREGKLWERYLESADGAPKEPRELMGAPFLCVDAPSPESMIVGNHFSYDDESIQTPHGVEVIRRPIANDGPSS
ncbi:MAG: hypothetical protein ABIJ96_12495, partial [Elusimicrobiota bacterium]